MDAETLQEPDHGAPDRTAQDRIAQDRTAQDLLAMTVDIVSAFVSHNPVRGPDLPELIASVHVALRQMSAPAPAPEPALKPAVPVRRSIQPDFLICLEDGKPFKSLKRHLRTHYGLSPEQYRERWGLAPDYPMVAPSYAAARSSLAKSAGLGQRRRKG